MTFEAEIPVFHPDRPGIRKVLGDLEAAIMKLIWARPIEQGTTVRDIFEQRYLQRRIAYTNRHEHDDPTGKKESPSRQETRAGVRVP